MQKFLRKLAENLPSGASQEMREARKEVVRMIDSSIILKFPGSSDVHEGAKASAGAEVKTVQAVTPVDLSLRNKTVPSGVTDEPGQGEEKADLDSSGTTGAPIKETRALQVLALACPGCGRPDMVKLTKELIPRSPLVHCAGCCGL